MMMNIPLFALLSAPMLVSGIAVDNYSDAANLRFSGQSGFIGDPYDFSGIGRTTDTVTASVNRTWATLLGENYFVSAVHHHPLTGETIQFKDGNSTSSTNYDYIVKGGFAVPGTDIWIGYTDEAINGSLKRHSLNTTPANSLADTGLAGQTLFMNGDRVAAGPGLVTDHVLGINEAESWWESGQNAHATPEWAAVFESAATFDQLITFGNEPGDTSNNVAFHEGQVQKGDSGAPLFRVASGDLEIVGINWAVVPLLEGNFVDTSATPEPLEERNASYYSYVGSYESQINSTISNVPAATPEPNSMGLIALASIFAYRRRR